MAATSPSYVDDIKKIALLRQNGVDDDSNWQLPLWAEPLRAIPNDAARSSLFTVTRGPRALIEGERLYGTSNTAQITYTGSELRAVDDELVWLQMLDYVSRSQQLKRPIHFTLYQLCKDLNWPVNSKYYKKAEQCLTRLKATALNFYSERAGHLQSLSLITEFDVELVGQKRLCRVTIDRRILFLFIGDYFTRVVWTKYRDLTPIARRLYDYAGSHKAPLPLAADSFMKLCGSRCASPARRLQMTKKACKELVDSGMVKAAWVEDKTIHFRR